MTNKHGSVTKYTAKLLDFPPVNTDKSQTMITIGDIHGNALKLLYVLIESGVIEATPDQYEKMKRLYYVENPTKADIDSFKQLVDSLKINNERPYLKILGDELADRGMNDFYTLYLLKHLHDHNVEFDINQSNHTIELTLAHEQTKTYSDTLGNNQCLSMKNLGILLQRGIVNPKEVDALMDIHKQHQCIINYSLHDEHHISIYSHAPVGFEMVRFLAQKFNIPYKDKHAHDIAFTIAQINEAYLSHVQAGTLSTLINKKIMFLINEIDNNKPLSMYSKRHALNELISICGHMSPQDIARVVNNAQNGNEMLRQLNITPENYPLEYITWGRNYDSIQRPLQPANVDYEVSYVHGHDAHHATLDEPHVFCLDNLFGKGIKYYVDPHCILMQQNRMLSEQELYDLATAELPDFMPETSASNSPTSNINDFDQDSQSETTNNFNAYKQVFAQVTPQNDTDDKENNLGQGATSP